MDAVKKFEKSSSRRKRLEPLPPRFFIQGINWKTGEKRVTFFYGNSYYDCRERFFRGGKRDKIFYGKGKRRVCRERSKLWKNILLKAADR
ncbi:MAG: hypothetical protein DBX39_05800 [Bacillota bacterium]|nr:MAG: hypothetical protein DBX39_05800 [Bacillota bacterium]